MTWATDAPLPFTHESASDGDQLLDNLALTQGAFINSWLPI